MSAASDAMCLAVLRGTTMRLPIEIEWQGDAETTFNAMCSAYSLTRLSAERKGQAARACNSRADCFVYLAKATSFDGSFSIYKVGTTKQPKYRMQCHERIPVLRWSDPVVEACYSDATARLAETAMLASAAISGFWIGGEWIAGCLVSRTLLAVSKQATRKDRRHRVRVSQEVPSGR